MINKLKNGFTLVELLIAMVVGLTILLAISSMMDIGLKSSSGVGRRVLTQQDSRAVLDIMAMEISMASLNPRMNSAVWTTGPNDTATTKCASLAAFVNVRKGIQIATANSILVAMDLNDVNGDGVAEGDNVIGPSATYPTAANEYISYVYDSANGKIRRAVSCGTYQDILGGTDSSTMVRNNLTSPVTPLFQYFNVAGTDISDAVIATPNTNIPLIRRIRINIIADVEIQQGNAFRTTRRTYSTDVLVRNHAM